MNRKEYIQLCQQVSMYLGTEYEIPQNLLVKHAEIGFYPLGYEITFIRGKPQHRAILHDSKANSLTYADLERVERYE